MQATAPNSGLYPAASVTEWNELVEKGVGLLEQMWHNGTASTKSPFILSEQTGVEQPGSVEQLGWTLHQIPRARGSTIHAQELNRLRSVEGMEQTSEEHYNFRVPTDPRSWQAFQVIQDRIYEAHESLTWRPPTRGRYDIICNTRGHLISWTRNLPPNQAAPTVPPGDLPKLHDFCDVGYLIFWRMFDPTDVAKYPLWLHISSVQEDHGTLSAVTWIMKMLGHHNSMASRSITIPIGTQAYNALIATPIVAEAAKMLIRYKHKFGVNVIIASITIFTSSTQTLAPHAGYDAPGFLVHAAPRSKLLETFRVANESYEDQNISRGRFKWPHSLKPLVDTGRAARPWALWEPPLVPPGNQIHPGQLLFAAGLPAQEATSSDHDGQLVAQNVEPTEAGTFNVADFWASQGYQLDEEFEGKKMYAVAEAGVRLLEAMLGNQQFLPKQVRDYTLDDIKQMQWAVSTKMPDLRPLQFLERCFGIEGFDEPLLVKNTPVSVAEKRHWAEYETNHLVEIDHPQDERLAGYQSLVSRKHQVIAQLTSHDVYPQGLVADDEVPYKLPDVRDWQELVVPIWQKGAYRHISEGLTPPAWWAILTAGISPVSPLAQEVIQRFLDDQGLDSVPAWPGITLPIGSTVYLQLLTTIEIGQVVSALTTRKKMFGDSVIASITVFDSGSDLQSRTNARLHFLANVRVVNNGVRIVRDRNRAFESVEGGPKAFQPKDPARPTGPLSSKVERPLWPYPMRPIRN